MQNHFIKKLTIFAGILLSTTQVYAHGIDGVVVIYFFSIYFVLHILPAIYTAFFPVKGDNRSFYLSLTGLSILFFWMVFTTHLAKIGNGALTLSLLAAPLIIATIIFFKRKELKKKHP